MTDVEKSKNIIQSLIAEIHEHQVGCGEERDEALTKHFVTVLSLNTTVKEILEVLCLPENQFKAWYISTSA